MTDVPGGTGITWQVHDAARPGLDTGSLRSVSGSPVDGFGNIAVQVDVEPQPRLNGELMRGFGLTFDGADTFATTQSVDLGGVHITRELTVMAASSATRFFDTFTNTTAEPVTVEVSFGGALGYGSGADQGAVRATSSGDTALTPDDAWTVVATTEPADRPVGVVLGTPAPFPGALTSIGNQERDPFRTARATEGHESNFYGFVTTLTVAPGETESLARFVQIGEPGAVDDAAVDVTALTAAPDLTGLTPGEICTLENWDLTALTVAGFDPADCAAVTTLPISPAPAAPPTVTSSPYDVVDASIAELQADLESGATTSQSITRAYLDRIAAYDTGQLGFGAFITVADDAMAQAAAADAARAGGATGELLGIPIALKDLYDTRDMPTTGGTLALADWQPDADAHQVALLRDAGAVIIGKTTLSEFANSGGYSESAFGQAWNALYPSKTSFGSSGGSAVAVAASMAAAAMGSQTGVSLYAPSVGNSITTFRGTDGMASVHGVMPLSWGQDYAGPMARTVTDLAYLLNATTGTDPKDVLTAQADAHRPADWTDTLTTTALQGTRIGYLPGSFVSGYSDDDTGAAVRGHFADLQAAGAAMVEMPAPPDLGRAPSGSRTEEGWARYIELHDDFPFVDGDALLASPLVLPYNRRELRDTPRMTPEEVDAWLAYRDAAKVAIAAWMDEHDVDAVVYPGFLSDVYNNDSATNQLTADRATGVLTSSVGLPTVVVPVGTNEHGYSVAMQLVGRAWDDAAVLGMGYALEQQADGRLVTGFAPPLEHVAPFEPPQFVDVVAGQDFYDDIRWLADSGLSTGTTVGDEVYFYPDRAMSRQAMAAFMYRYAGVVHTPAPGRQTFDDVAPGSPFFAAIEWMAAEGLATGYDGDLFGPARPVSRQAMAAFLYRLAGEPAVDGPAAFTDVPAGSPFVDAIAWLQDTGVAEGYPDGTFGPAVPISRQAMAAFLHRFDGLADGPLEARQPTASTLVAPTPAPLRTDGPGRLPQEQYGE
ncbi:amidase family protein [uncultured Cellulomonas sp.]|uniref:amidase family protein n=1 Tax=uncultured Cellulomonas sp. TaxID=189682 RepID=UPI00262C8A92|nr:amidase family protein [uncultured Cellulomonas sp.]